MLLTMVEKIKKTDYTTIFCEPFYFTKESKISILHQKISIKKQIELKNCVKHNLKIFLIRLWRIPHACIKESSLFL